MKKRLRPVPQNNLRTSGVRSLTRVKELSPDEGAVIEERFCGSDVLEGAVHKQRVFKLHRLHLHVDEPARISTVR